MDILTHTLSGLATGTVIAGFSRERLKSKLYIIATGGIAGALPDLDAISLWSGFDATFGRLFNLEHTGREIYSGKFWYSHHAFMHSIAAAMIISALIGTVNYLLKEKFRKPIFRRLIKSIRNNRLLHISFISGYLVHLFEDMPTPASSWGGVNLFWPSRTYVGGVGDIWWWNNYDIFLIVLGVLVINLILLSIRFTRKNWKPGIISGVFMLGLLFSLYQIKSREFDFAYSGNTNRYHEFEAKSKDVQKEILGKQLFNLMETFDNKLIVYF